MGLLFNATGIATGPPVALPLPALAIPDAVSYWSPARATTVSGDLIGPGDVAASIRDALGTDHMNAAGSGTAPVRGDDNGLPFVTFTGGGSDLTSGVSCVGSTVLAIVRAANVSTNILQAARGTIGRGPTGRIRANVTLSGGGTPQSLTTTSPSTAGWQVLVFQTSAGAGPKLFVMSAADPGNGVAYTPPSSDLAISHPVTSGQTADVGPTIRWNRLLTVDEITQEITKQRANYPVIG